MHMHIHMRMHMRMRMHVHMCTRLVHVEARRLGGEWRLAEAVRKVELDHRAIGLMQPPA